MAHRNSADGMAARGTRTRKFAHSILPIGFVAVILTTWLVSVTPLRGAEACLSCHGPGTGLANSQGKSITINPATLQHSVHKDFGCVDCHAGAAKFPHTAKTAAASCLTCHSDVGQTLALSAHAMLGQPNTSEACIACHGTHDVVNPATRGIRFCATCHDTEVKQYSLSIHGQARARGDKDAATCESCHGPAHRVLVASDAKSPVNKLNLPQTCGHCHSNPELVAKYMFAVARPVEAYEQGTHGRAIKKGNMNAASCNDCHGVHDILPASDPRSTIWKQNVPATCGKCHKKIYDVYRQSIHGTALQAGVLEAPACDDCHGEHRILAPGNPHSPVYMANVSQATCSRCHDNIQLMARFNIPSNRVPTYENSYHGLAAQAGQETVANCASCHGVHNIFPSSDPRSTVNKANLGATCGKCHPHAGTRFALGPVHSLPPSTVGGRVLDFVKVFYLIVIPTILGFMLLHNGLDLWRKARRALAQYRLSGAPIRMTLSERVQHVLLLVSFIVLVISGFALKYPHAFWDEPIVAWEKGFPLRGLIHRVAAVVLIGAGVYHLVYLMVTRSGREWMRGMIPKVRDVREAIYTVGYNLGYRPNPPRYAHFNYIEKAEYWALVWGTVVMAATGILLWSHDWVLAHLPYALTVLDVATAIHFYEAVLATLAIVVWHFYAVIFDPEVYPLKWTFFTGRAPEHEVREEEPEPPKTKPQPAPPAPAAGTPAGSDAGPPADSPQEKKPSDETLGTGADRRGSKGEGN
jgi:formate dehydrogenase gamma subunit